MKDFKEALPGLITMICAGAIVAAFFWNLHKEAQEKETCQSKCGIILSEMIHGQCYCAIDKGWEKK